MLRRSDNEMEKLLDIIICVSWSEGYYQITIWTTSPLDPLIVKIYDLYLKWGKMRVIFALGKSYSSPILNFDFK